ncbi:MULTISPECIES: hypothetical protein [Bacillus]|uniref:Uncharacterized protein n=1 Tax=Bacillus thuringiensis T01-328 TaxID=1324966 RepID=A0AAN4KQT6_BACTU|nr:MULTISPECIES: hypothetical protein [Bacillus]MCU5283261.1 hypothetical protein [Bacillus cereus]AFV21558.1 hypothetical protein BTB_502p02530 [Bacillus thuringiensis Bt407]EEM25409.1 hypothetical protein bthur0002_60510 [Bacillus thuringiensis Bt407]ERI01266.1 hypothetical protein BTCBT_002821 [Bacillus thuringiensis T01-328]MEC0046198.1 hypothetical protein [Bacillus cereus]
MVASKKKREMFKIATERGCKCENDYYWFQMRDGTVGCNECVSLIITDVEYKEIKQEK